MNLNQFKGLDYEPSDAESEVMLSDIPLDILMTSVRNQFDNLSDYVGTDYMQTFITRYTVTKDNTLNEDDELERVRKYYEIFVGFMEELLSEKLGVGIPDLEDMGEDEALEILHYIYRYFLLNMERNFTSFVYNYIEENKEKCAKDLLSRENTTTEALKKVMDDDDMFLIISNLPIVVGACLTDESTTVDQFLTYSHGKGDYLENEYIQEKYDAFQITGNFVDKYKDLMEASELRIKVEIGVQEKLLNKHVKK